MTVDSFIPHKVSGRRTIARTAIMFVATSIVVAIPAFAIGYLAGYVSARGERGTRDIAMVNEIITENPNRYSTLTINRGPLDKFLVEGTVSSQQIADELRQQLIKSFGERRADRVLAVEVDDAPTPKANN